MPMCAIAQSAVSLEMDDGCPSLIFNLPEINMHQFPTYRRTLACSILLISLLGVSACNMSPMASDTSTTNVSLSGANEVPATSSSGVGSMTANLDKQTNLFTWTVTYSGLSGPVTGAHFHGPAKRGENAGVALPLTGSLESPIRGTATLTGAQREAVVNGNWYINLHTAANPNGEIRGQIAMYP